MKYYAPFACIWNYWMISFENSHLNLVKLSIKTTFKFVLNEQTGLYENFLNDLTSNSLNVYLRKQTPYKLDYNETLKVKLVKNLFGQKLVITSGENLFNLYVQNTINKSDLYADFKKHLKDNFLN